MPYTPVSVSDIDELLRRGEIEQAAALARKGGNARRAAELLALAGRHAEGVLVALEAGEWRVAFDLALGSADDRIIAAVCDQLGKDGNHAALAAAQARIARRVDIAARVLETSDPAAAANAWYEAGDYLRAARCFDKAQDVAQAVRAFEQHLAQDPNDVAAAIRLAELRAMRGNPEGSVRALQSAMRAGGGGVAMQKLVEALHRVGLDGSAPEPACAGSGASMRRLPWTSLTTFPCCPRAKAPRSATPDDTVCCAKWARAQPGGFSKPWTNYRASPSHSKCSA